MRVFLFRPRHPLYDPFLVGGHPEKRRVLYFLTRLYLDVVGLRGGSPGDAGGERARAQGVYARRLRDGNAKGETTLEDRDLPTCGTVRM